MIHPTWQVSAWVTAPGDFPQHSLRTIELQAETAAHAVIQGERRAAQGFVEPITVVRVVRTNPPVKKQP